MRPDEHKKKKSAAYKKKQANTATKGAQGSNKDQHRKNTKPNNVVDEVEKKEEKFSGADQFKKRTLHSNWERYEEKEEMKTIGSTYEELLSSASDPSSNLILEVEKDWDNYPDFDADLFGIDCHHIHTILQNFNFSDRFDFDARDIDPELLDLMKSPNASKQVEKISDVTIVRDVMLDRNKIKFTNPNELKKETRIKAATTERKTTKIVDIPPPVEGTSKSTKHKSPEENKTIEDRKPLGKKVVTDSFFEDLDKIDSTATTTTHVEPTNNEEEGDKVDDLEDWLDSII